jgi:hypothetical protein
MEELKENWMRPIEVTAAGQRCDKRGVLLPKRAQREKMLEFEGSEVDWMQCYDKSRQCYVDLNDDDDDDVEADEQEGLGENALPVWTKWAHFNGRTEGYLPTV